MNTLDTVTRVPLHRRTLLKGAGALGLGLGLTHLDLLRSLGQVATPSPGAAPVENIQDILNVTVTVEMFGVAFLGAGLDSNSKANYSPAWPAEVVAIVTAARAQEQAHLTFFQSLGGQPLVQGFTLPDPALLTNMTAFFDAVQAEETREIAAQIAAMTTFTQMNRPDLVKASFQYAAEEAEHRVLANYAKGARPANNYAFAPALYTSAAAIIADFRKLGIIGGTGAALPFPGPGTIDATNVIETTPSGPAVSCAGTGGANATGGATATAGANTTAGGNVTAGATATTPVTPVTTAPPVTSVTPIASPATGG